MTARSLNKRGKARRDELINVAMRVVAERGLDKTRLADVAAEAKVPASLPYWYFRNLDDLLAQAMVDARRAIRVVVADATADISDPLERLFVGVRAAVVHAIDDDILRALTLADVESVVASDYAEEMRRSVEVFIDDTLRLLAEGQAQGVVRDDRNALHLAYCIRGVVHYNVSAFHRGYIIGSADTLAHTIASCAIRSVCATQEHAVDVESRHVEVPALA